jgi:hypothetical protein
MPERTSRTHWRIRTIALAAILVCAPVAVSQDGVGSNDACAAGCCSNPEGLCEAAGRLVPYYENPSLFQRVFGC